MSATTLPAALPTTGTWSVDPIHSTARFAITHHAIATFRAGFDSIQRVLAGEPPLYPCNPEVLPAWRKRWSQGELT